jgi:hypothetical protein
MWKSSIAGAALSTLLAATIPQAHAETDNAIKVAQKRPAIKVSPAARSAIRRTSPHAMWTQVGWSQGAHNYRTDSRGHILTVLEARRRGIR